MSLHTFLAHLAQSPAELRGFFVHSRQAMLQNMGRKYNYVPHQLLEDAVMHVYSQLWNGKLGQFRSQHSVTSLDYRQDLIRYLALTIAPRRLIDQLRRSARETPVGDFSMWGEEGVSDDWFFDKLLPPDDEDPLVSNLARQQLLQRLQQCVDHLSPKLRDVVLGLLNDMKQVDTAQALGIPEGTVKSRMNEAIKKLKRCMGISMEAT